MLRIAWRLTRGYHVTPWRSPYLRWRIETYSGAHAEQLDRVRFIGLCWKYRREFLRYLAWAAGMDAAHRS